MKTFTKRCACGALYSAAEFYAQPHPYQYDYEWGEREVGRMCTAILTFGTRIGQVCSSHMAIGIDIKTGEVIPDSSVTIEEVRGAA